MLSVEDRMLCGICEGCDQDPVQCYEKDFCVYEELVTAKETGKVNFEHKFTAVFDSNHKLIKTKEIVEDEQR